MSYNYFHYTNGKHTDGSLVLSHVEIDTKKTKSSNTLLRCIKITLFTIVILITGFIVALTF